MYITVCFDKRGVERAYPADAPPSACRRGSPIARRPGRRFDVARRRVFAHEEKIGPTHQADMSVGQIISVYRKCVKLRNQKYFALSEVENRLYKPPSSPAQRGVS